MELEATLPYPPTVNKYWITRVSKKINPLTGKRTKLVSRTTRAKKYTQDVGYIMRSKRFKPLVTPFLRLEVYVYPPDHRKRDIDNLCKSILDSLQASGIFKDDFQIWQLYVQRCEIVRGGEIKIKLSEMKT